MTGASVASACTWGGGSAVVFAVPSRAAWSFLTHRRHVVWDKDDLKLLPHLCFLIVEFDFLNVIFLAS